MKHKQSSTKGGKTYQYAPRMIPYNLVNAFLMDGKSLCYHYYLNDIHKHVQPLLVSSDAIRKGINAATEKRTINDHTDAWLYALLSDTDMTGNIVMIYGCDTPWYACIALANGAKGVVVVSEQAVECDDPRVVTALPDQIQTGFADYCINIGAVNHVGLGRFGHELDADGDMAAMRVCADSLKKGGRMFLSVPCGRDMLVWNTNRVYGANRLKKLCEGWTLVNVAGWDDVKAKARTTSSEYMPVFEMEAM